MRVFREEQTELKESAGMAKHSGTSNRGPVHLSIDLKGRGGEEPLLEPERTEAGTQESEGAGHSHCPHCRLSRGGEQEIPTTVTSCTPEARGHDG